MSDETGMWSNITDKDIEKADDSLEPKQEMGMGGLPGFEPNKPSDKADE